MADGNCLCARTQSLAMKSPAICAINTTVLPNGGSGNYRKSAFRAQGINWQGPGKALGRRAQRERLVQEILELAAVAGEGLGADPAIAGASPERLTVSGGTSCVPRQRPHAGGAKAHSASASIDLRVFPIRGEEGGRRCLPVHNAPSALPGAGSRRAQVVPGLPSLGAGSLDACGTFPFPQAEAARANSFFGRQGETR
jgi:hypothetical protein